MNDAEAHVVKVLGDILSFFGVNTDIEVGSSDNVINASVPSTDMNGFLIGERGNNLHAIQYLVNTMMKSSDFSDWRVSVDIADYKAQRADRLAEQVQEWAAAVIKSGVPMELQHMSALDRRTVHQTIGEIDAVQSESSGEGRDRHIVLKPSAE